MNKPEDYQSAKNRIKQETEAEIAFGEYLEQSGVDCDAFMRDWQITHSQFNAISHYLHGTDERCFHAAACPCRHGQAGCQSLPGDLYTCQSGLVTR